MYLGDFIVGSVIDFKWNTISYASGSITRATDGAIRIYKNNSITPRTSSNGVTDTEDFDGLTGLHHCRIDLSDNSDAGFYAAGNDYDVVIQGAVVDGATINAVIAKFSIENRNDKVDVREWIGTAVATPTVAGVPEVDVTHVVGGATTATFDTIKAETAAILTDTAEIGAAGAGLTALATQASVNVIDDFLDTEVAAILTAVDTEVAAIKAKTDNLPASPAAAGDQMALTAAAVDAIHDEVIDGSLTLRQSMRLQNAVLFGKVTGGGTLSVTFRNPADSLNRVVATVDAAGNRSAIATDVS